MRQWIIYNMPLEGREGDEYITLTKGSTITITLNEVHSGIENDVY